MESLLWLFFSVILCTSLAVNSDDISGDFFMDLCNEFGSQCSKKNLQNNAFWVRFLSQNMPRRIFWLRIDREEVQKYPVKVKSGNKAYYSQSGAWPSMDCHFVATSPLLVLPHEHIPRNISVPGTIGDGPLPISLCAGVSGIVSEPSGRYLVRLDPLLGRGPPSVRLTRVPRLLIGRMAEMRGHNQWRKVADRAARRRIKRAVGSFRMPVNERPGPFLVELYLIVDSKMAGMYPQNDYAKLLSRIRSIMNQINVAFMQFNIFFTVVQLEIWEQDQFKITDENHILNELQLYKRQFVKERHDCLHAILGENLGSARRGQSEAASICAYNRCVGYTKDYWGLSELEIAHSVVHEIGHNFGLKHDTERCHCFGCIMATGVEFGNLKFQWSNCSLRQMPSLLRSGMADCLRDRPGYPLGSIRPVVMSLGKVSRGLADISMQECGNGVVDEGEQCDCGGRAHCSLVARGCCNPDTCRFTYRSSCASGACCDLSSCSFRKAGTICRSVGDRDCDLPEYCSGTSEWCPADVHKADGQLCTTALARDSSHCYHGECQSRKSWCRVLFGSTAEEASSLCFRMNRIGDEVKNCGLEVPPREDRYSHPKRWDRRPCREENLMCGRLWCSHTNERLLRSSVMTVVEEMVGGFHCSAARFFLDWFLDDAGLVPNGTPCGSGKMCWRGACIHSVFHDMGGCYCHGHGVCNNRGNCHCAPGFAPPNCTSLGNGGSVDSGSPARYHRAWSVIFFSVLVAVVLVVTAFVVVTILYHYNTRRWPKFLSEMRWPQFRKVESIVESKEPIKFENNYSKFNFHLNPSLLKPETKSEAKTPVNHHADPCLPSAPAAPLLVRPPISPPSFTDTSKTSKPLLTVKSKAAMFDKGPVAVVPKVKVPLLQPPIVASKPAKGSQLKKEPPILSSKPPPAVSKTLKPALLEKPLPIITAQPPPLLGDKPAKAAPPKRAASAEESGPSHSGKPAPSGKATKAQISQPKLEQTTCTATTRDLETTDRTLRRAVSPHKVLRVDPRKSVKYLY